MGEEMPEKINGVKPNNRELRCKKCNCILRKGNNDEHCSPCARKIRLSFMGLQHKSFLLDTDPEFSKI
jgi:hypothetical protein